jgi:hypothetical protein
MLMTESEIVEWVEQMAQILDLPLEPDYRAGVIGNFTRTAAIAQQVLEFPLPDDLEIAPTFEP